MNYYNDNDKYNRLLVVGYRPGKKTPSTHPFYECICDCGNKRLARATDVRRGKVLECVECARKTASKKASITMSLPEEERALRRKYGHYKSNSKVKKIKFDLTFEQCERIFKDTCFYCGSGKKYNGIDRKDNELGYDLSNVVSCCSICNYAKRDMAFSDFLTWINKVHKNINR